MPNEEGAPESSVPADAYFNPTGFWDRFHAKVTDIFLFIISIWLLANLLRQGLRPDLLLVLLILPLPIYFSLYNFLMHIVWGQTVGKMMMGIKVLDVSGQPIARGQSLRRALSEYLSLATLGIGYLLTSFMDRKQSLHDLICGTVVLRVRTKGYRIVPLVIYPALIFFTLLFVGIANTHDVYRSKANAGARREVNRIIRVVKATQKAFFAKNGVYTTDLPDLYDFGFKLHPRFRLVLCADQKTAELLPGAFEKPVYSSIDLSQAGVSMVANSIYHERLYFYSLSPLVNENYSLFYVSLGAGKEAKFREVSINETWSPSDGDNLRAKSQVESAVSAERTFFAKNNRYTTKLSDLSSVGFKPDPDVRIMLCSGQQGIKENFTIVGEHLYGGRLWIYDNGAGGIKVRDRRSGRSEMDRILAYLRDLFVNQTKTSGNLY